MVEIGLGQRDRISRAAGKKIRGKDFIGHQDFRRVAFKYQKKFLAFFMGFEGFGGVGDLIKELVNGRV